MDFGLRMFACQISGKEYPNTMKTKVLLAISCQHTHRDRQMRSLPQQRTILQILMHLITDMLNIFSAVLQWNCIFSTWLAEPRPKRACTSVTYTSKDRSGYNFSESLVRKEKHLLYFYQEL